MSFYIPQNNDERVVWATNFMAKFPDIGAANGFSDEQIARATAACETIIFSITLAKRARLFAKVCTTFRNTMVKSKDEKTPSVPFFIMPDAPATLSPPDAVGYLQKIARELKSKSSYRHGFGLELRIVTPPKSAAAREDAVPRVKFKSLPNSVVRIDWTKRGFDGVIVESKRGDETEWTEIGRDNYSPYIDTRPPLVAGKPEIRYYRLIYIYEDKPVGNYSPIYTQVTTP
jgi:hypothetical protein